ncbi:MAG: family 16 glycosylhydrolase [Rikenellaceae bacterium]
MKNSTLTAMLLLAATTLASCSGAKSESIYGLTPHNSQDVFILDDIFTSEFNTGLENDNLFINNGRQGVWTLNPDNVTVEDGVLNLTAKHDPREFNERQYYFSSGMVRSKGTTTYGYFEARIKGADLWPGVCPAFWLTTEGNFSNAEAIKGKPENTITYSEIDIVEIQQVARDKRIMACNIHTGAVMRNKDGELYAQSLLAGRIPTIGKNEFLVDWDAEDDYHIYACENRPDSVLFYIDNELVAARPNYYWHLPMCMKVSVGIRTPFEAYEGWSRYPVAATAEEAAEAGFPTTMYVDYIRSYTRDYSAFKSNQKLFDAEEAQFSL